VDGRRALEDEAQVNFPQCKSFFVTECAHKIHIFCFKIFMFFLKNGVFLKRKILIQLSAVFCQKPAVPFQLAPKKVHRAKKGSCTRCGYRSLLKQKPGQNLDK